MKRAIVFSGGGSKGSFQLGVLLSLLEQGLTFDFVSGTSVGAIIGFMHAFGHTEYMVKQWMSIRGIRDVFESQSIQFAGAWLGISSCTPSLYRPGKIMKGILNVPLRDIATTLHITVTNLITGQLEIIDQTNPNLRQFVVASASIPIILPPIHINGGVYVDGGIRNITPLNQAIKNGCEEIHVVLSSPMHVQKHESNYCKPFEVISRSVELLIDELYVSDIKVCLHKNKIEQYKKIKLFVYEPHKQLNNMLDFSKQNIVNNIEHGKIVGKQAK